MIYIMLTNSEGETAPREQFMPAGQQTLSRCRSAPNLQQQLQLEEGRFRECKSERNTPSPR